MLRVICNIFTFHIEIQKVAFDETKLAKIHIGTNGTLPLAVMWKTLFA